MQNKCITQQVRIKAHVSHMYLAWPPLVLHFLTVLYCICITLILYVTGYVSATKWRETNLRFIYEDVLL